MIDLTPLDVRKKKGDFARALRGYEIAPVDEFLDLAAERMEELARENAALRDRVTHLTESLSGFRQREQAMNDALISAQQLREEVRTQAAREAELVVREARSEADRIVGESRTRAVQITESLQRVQASRERFLRNFRTFVQRQLEELEMEVERGDGVDVEQAPPPKPAVAKKRPEGAQ